MPVPLTDAQLQRFLDELAAIGNVYHAAQRAKVTRSALYKYRRLDAEFRRAWDEALEMGKAQMAPLLKDHLIDRVLLGPRTRHYAFPADGPPKFLGTYRGKPEPQLLIFALKSLDPDTFGEKTGVTTEQVLRRFAAAMAARARDEGKPMSDEEAFRIVTEYLPVTESVRLQ